ncbi:hypothetical protein HDU81_006021 [Chytriomyces hyalinus]|nr:hypothetical protein HDU81_006021 [Chytriomyces hyalinus]
MNEDNEFESGSIVLPTIDFLQNKMQDMSFVLYRAWKQVICIRLKNLELEGDIEDRDIEVPNCVWKLPNAYIRSALRKLENDLDTLGYEYEFRFDVDELRFSMHYHIEIPEDSNIQKEMKMDKANNDANYKHLLKKISGEHDSDAVIL